MAVRLSNNLDLERKVLLNALLHPTATDPGTPDEGQIWYNSTAKAFKYYNGTEILTLGVAGAGGDASTLDGNDSTYYLDRTNHTGEQAITTITGLQAALDDKLDDILAGANNGLATLDGSGKIPNSQLPELSITSVSVVADIAARDALTVQEGDVAIVTDTGAGESATYIYDGTDWQILPMPAGGVTSVNGDTGPSVTLTTGDIAEDTDARYVSDAQETKLDSLPSGPLSFVTNVGDGAATAITVTHNLGTQDVHVTVRDNGTNAEVLADNVADTANTVVVTFATAPATDAYRVIVSK